MAAKQPTPDKYDALDAYVAELQVAMNVTYWKITVARDASDVEAWADINPHAQAETAELRVSHDFWKQTPELQREVLTHEMLHVVTARLDQTVEAMEEAFGKIAWAIYDPLGYVRTIAALMPKEVELVRPLEALTDDELSAIAEQLRSALGAGSVRAGDSPPRSPTEVN